MTKQLMRPLDGILVVSLEHAIAAPFCTRQLADLGARVIKVERPGVGDFARAYDERVRGLSSHFVWVNRSKESLTLDVKQPSAAKVLQTLMSKPVRHYRPGTDIVREGDDPKVVRLILSGWAYRYKVLPDGRRQVVAL